MCALSGELLKRRSNVPRTSFKVDLATVPSRIVDCESQNYEGFRDGEFTVKTRLFRCAHPYSKSLLPQDFGRRLREEESRRIYGVGDASAGDSAVPPVDVDVPGEDSVVEAGLVASVVAAGGLVAAGLATGSVVSVFCSHAARSAALARMQIYFFIVLIGRGTLL